MLLAITNKRTSKAEVLTILMEGFDPAFREELAISAILVEERPPPPENLRAINVQTRYIILAWDKPQYGSNYQISNYTIRKKKTSDNFTEVQTLPRTRTGIMMKNLEPDTEYTITLSSNNKYGRSDDALLTQRTLPDRFIKRLMLIIVIPLSLAVSFVAIICLKFRPTCQKKSGQTEKSVLWKRGNWVELPRSHVQLQEKLGEGAFGEAFKGLLRIGGEIKLCAVKKLKENATETEKRDLINELQIMTTVGEHPNLISLIGACTEREPVLVVVRLAPNGCLLNHLRNNENPYINVRGKQKHLTHMDQLRIARDIANGMSHLSNKKCVHRDLAARNVLLGDDFVAMVSDFGLSRDVYESGEYENTSGGMLPVRWMALESLENYTYNTKTDVWSFGVVLWEIASGGKT